MTVRKADCRHLALEELESTLARELADASQSGLLWTAQRPRKRWFDGISSFHPLVLASSARFEQIFWLPPGWNAMASPEQAQECKFLLDGYPALYQEAPLEVYAQCLTEHISQHEDRLFRDMKHFLPELERALQELAYEHRGLEKGLQRLPQVLQSHKTGELSSRERERFDLDFYHLLEHNLERKLDAIYPLLNFLGLDRKEE